MPEGHSIHRIARQMSDVFTGERVHVSSPQGRFTDGAALLDGHIITGAYAHGKHLFVTFDNELTLNVHLGIYGNWTFGGDETFTGASSIGAPRKIGEKEYAAGEGAALRRPARAESHGALPYCFGARLGRPGGSDYLPYPDPGGGAHCPLQARPRPAQPGRRPGAVLPRGTQELPPDWRDSDGSVGYLWSGQYLPRRVALPPGN